LAHLAELVTAVIALATLLVLAPLIAPLPQAALAAVVVAYSIPLIRAEEFRSIRRVPPIEFRWALVAFAGVVALGTLPGIVAAVIVSVLSLIQQTNDPAVYVVGRKRGTDVFRPLSDEHATDETFPGLLMLRVEGRVYFGNAQRVSDKLEPLIEQAALKMLTEAEERARRDGITVWLAAFNPEVRHVVEHSPLGTIFGRDRMLFNLESAVEKFERSGLRRSDGPT